jgi:1,2-diacylglycerol 3-alpha-glucosyltransferase
MPLRLRLTSPSEADEMRIGMMADLYKPHMSGVTNFIDLNKRELEQAGHTVYVFTFGDPDFADDEPNVIRSPGIPLAETGAYLSLSYPRRARRLLESMDLVHVHHPFLSGRLAIRYCRPYNIPVVFTNHTRYDLYAQAYLPVLPDQVGIAFLQAYMPWLCREMDLVIAPSAGLQRVLVGLGVQSPIVVLPNGIDLAPFREKREPMLPESVGLLPGGVVLIYVGRLGPEKNLTFLVRAFAGVAAAFPEVRLLLVGDGPERDNLEDRVARSGLQGRVGFAGQVDYADLPPYLGAADAFVTASVTEVHPLSVIEAMASGLPVLGIASPGIEDMVEDGVTGYLSPDDLPAFTAKMTRLVAERERRREMSQNARQAAEEYAIERTSARLMQHYDKLVIERPRRERRAQLLWRRVVDRWT